MRFAEPTRSWVSSTIIHDLLAEHLGQAPATVAETMAKRGLLRAVEVLGQGARCLAPLPGLDRNTVGDELYISLADPERPVSLRDFLPQFQPDDCGETAIEQKGRRRSVLPLVLGALLLGTLALIWRITPLSALASPEFAGEMLQNVRNAPWTPLLVLALYIVGGLLMFPVLGLILATGIAFDVPMAMVYALTGSVASALAGYFAGRYFEMSFITKRQGRRLRSVVDAVRRRGLLAVATVRLVPVAPFTVVNVIAGAARIRMRDYLLGTVLGMAPGIACCTVRQGNRLSSKLP